MIQTYDLFEKKNKNIDITIISVDESTEIIVYVKKLICNSSFNIKTDFNLHLMKQ